MVKDFTAFKDEQEQIKKCSPPFASFPCC